MSSLTLDNNVTFSYTDSGAVAGSDRYTTLVVLHGHTFHNGTFQRLNPLAGPSALRIIAVNRREYPGSSAYTTEEVATFAGDDDERRASLLAQQGLDLALFVDQLIESLSLPEAGGVVLIAWSMGAIFLSSLIASITALPAATQTRLSRYVHTVIYLQVPTLALGVPAPDGFLIPHTDPAIAPEDRAAAFASWVSSYFVHTTDFASGAPPHDLASLSYSATSPDPAKTPTIARLAPAELAGMTDFAPGERYDNAVGLQGFRHLVSAQTHAALFDTDVRGAWARAQGRFWSVYGSAEPWNVVHGAWWLEDESRRAAGETKDASLQFQVKLIDGANHFLVWEDPERAIEALKDCIATPPPPNPSASSHVRGWRSSCTIF